MKLNVPVPAGELAIDITGVIPVPSIPVPSGLLPKPEAEELMVGAFKGDFFITVTCCSSKSGLLVRFVEYNCESSDHLGILV